ncbi:hypothetical protein [Flavilitoribacter nigricans]|nr:hypothetical protein [Flavilitoribacter nigricans]
MSNGTILKYLQGKLPEEDRVDFERQLREDAALAEAVEREKEVQIAVDLIARYRKREQVAAIAEGLEEEAPKRMPLAKVAGSFLLQPMGRVAAGVLLLIVAGFVFLQQRYSDAAIMRSFGQRYELDLTDKGGGAQEETLKAAMENYKAGNYEQALEQFSGLPNTINEYWLVQLFIGNCELELKRYQSAADTFSRIVGESEFYEETARWYLALAQLGANRGDQARATLNAIAPGQFNYTKSQQMLSRIDSPFRHLPGI